MTYIDAESNRSRIVCIMVVAESDWMRIQNLPNRIGCGVKNIRVRTPLIYIYCCDRKARTACAQSFTLWQQATKEITRRDHSIIACSCHKYIWVLFFATSRSWWITHSMQHQRRSCNISKFENFGIFSECLEYIFLIWHM